MLQNQTLLYDLADDDIGGMHELIKSSFHHYSYLIYETKTPYCMLNGLAIDYYFKILCIKKRNRITKQEGIAGHPTSKLASLE